MLIPPVISLVGTTPGGSARLIAASSHVTPVVIVSKPVMTYGGGVNLSSALVDTALIAEVNTRPIRENVLSFGMASLLLMYLSRFQTPRLRLTPLAPALAD